MDFEEFCAAAVSPYQMEALEGWEQIASTAFEHFELEGNRAISVEELAQVRYSILLQSHKLLSPCIMMNFDLQEMNLGPAAHPMVRDWIRPSDGKLNFLGYTKFLHGVTIRSSNTRHHHN